MQNATESARITKTEPMIAMKYTGPKPVKYLQLPVGIESSGDVEYEATFMPGENMTAEIPARYISGLLSIDHYKFANEQARRLYEDWLSSPGTPAPAEPPVNPSRPSTPESPLASYLELLEPGVKELI